MRIEQMCGVSWLRWMLWLTVFAVVSYCNYSQKISKLTEPLGWAEEHQYCLLRADPTSSIISSVNVECHDLPYVSYFRSLMVCPRNSLLQSPYKYFQAHNPSITSQTQFMETLELLGSAIFNLYRETELERLKPVHMFHVPTRSSNASTPNRELKIRNSGRNENFRMKAHAVTVFSLLYPVLPLEDVHFQIPTKSQLRFQGPRWRQKSVPEYSSPWQELQDSLYYVVDIADREVVSSFSLEQDTQLLVALASGTLPVCHSCILSNYSSRPNILKNRLLSTALSHALFSYMDSFGHGSAPSVDNALLRYEQMDRRLYSAVVMALQQFVRSQRSTQSLVTQVLLALSTTSAGFVSGDLQLPKKLVLMSTGGQLCDLILTAFAHGVLQLFQPSVHVFDASRDSVCGTGSKFGSDMNDAKVSSNGNIKQSEGDKMQLLVSYDLYLLANSTRASSENIHTSDKNWASLMLSQSLRRRYSAAFFASEPTFHTDSSTHSQPFSHFLEQWTENCLKKESTAIVMSVSLQFFEHNTRENEKQLPLWRQFCANSSVHQWIFLVSNEQQQEATKYQMMSKTQRSIHIERYVNAICARESVKKNTHTPAVTIFLL